MEESAPLRPSEIWNQHVELLPSEVWNHIFRYLSADDKFRIRACCKYFKKLVDHKSLWKGWTVVLGFKNGSYNRQFWTTLRRREVTSVLVRSNKEKDWKLLSWSLPALTTIIIDGSCKFSPSFLDGFQNLQRLVIRDTKTCGMLDASMLCRPQQLTHLSLCDIGSLTPTTGCFISAVCQFTELTSLACHHIQFSMEENYLLTLLTRLTKLRHLSLSMVHGPYNTDRPDQGLLEGAHEQPVASPLSSLELIDCFGCSLPRHAMRLMPGLRSLSVSYSTATNLDPSREYNLNMWLSDLPQLSTLAIVGGPLVTSYLASIPTTVTSLALTAAFSYEDLLALSRRLPNLLHLRLEPWLECYADPTAMIPRIFPKLKSLKLDHEPAPEKDFLNLHQLQDLEYLEILDSSPQLPELTAKLRALSGHRFQISQFQTDVLSCQCFYPRIIYKLGKTALFRFCDPLWCRRRCAKLQYYCP